MNGIINQTVFTDRAAFVGSALLGIKQLHIDQIRTAVTALESYVLKVDNCGNCIFCQTCQGCQGCQTCQGCQSQCHCDCDCNDSDGGS